MDEYVDNMIHVDLEKMAASMMKYASEIITIESTLHPSDKTSMPSVCRRYGRLRARKFSSFSPCYSTTKIRSPSAQHIWIALRKAIAKYTFPPKSLSAEYAISQGIRHGPLR